MYTRCSSLSRHGPHRLIYCGGLSKTGPHRLTYLNSYIGRAVWEGLDVSLLGFEVSKVHSQLALLLMPFGP